MVHYPFPSGRRAPRRKRRTPFLTAALVTISLSPLAFFADLSILADAPPVEASVSVTGRAPVQGAAAVASTRLYDRAFVDSTPALSPKTLDFAHNAPLASAFRPWPAQREAGLQPPVAQAQPEPAQPPQPLPAAKLAEAVQPVPLPVPRPAEFQTLRPSEAPRTARAAAAPMRSAALPSAPADTRSFFEKLFGLKPASPPEAALGYAALDSGTGSIAPGSRFNTVPSPAADEKTAVYDITAKVVIMPNGERLEAHSGLGDKLDDPRYVHVRMKGATPPGTYILTEREALFHGVRALRMHPVGGSAAIYGRDGILAHTYMLGPNGDSNGCVSFKNYDRFLQAYLRGEVKRLVVVAGRGQDLLPRMVNTRTGRPQRSTRDI